MTVVREAAAVRLEGECRVEEAEALVALLQAGGIECADLSACRHLHGAVAQVLIAFAVPVRDGAEDPFVRDVLIPALQAAGAGREEHASNGGLQPPEVRS